MLDDAALYRAMEAVAEAGAGVVLHAETGPVLDILRADALAAGRTAAIEHERTRPTRMEASAVHRAAEIARLADCRLLVFHVGNGAVAQEIAVRRQQGDAIWGETCPQYLVLTSEEDLGSKEGVLFICAPPLRPEHDRKAVWQALGEDTLQVVSTDHCPWTRAEKSRDDFTQVPGGVPGIEARLALVHHFGVVEGRISVEGWVKVCCETPAKLMGLERKGRIEVGMDADIVLFDPGRTKVISQKAESRSLHEGADWTPYEGIEVAGWPRTVLLRGRPIVQDEVYVGRAGDGRFVKRGAPFQVSGV
jgi:dihydropyrimidinase